MVVATATDVQNNFGYYLQTAVKGNEVLILKNGKEVARLVAKTQAHSFLTDSLQGVLKKDYDDKSVREERVFSHENLD